MSGWDLVGKCKGETMHKLRYPLPEMPKYTKQQIKMTGIIHRLQQIMINENLSGDELVECAIIVRGSHQQISKIINTSVG